MKFLLVLVGVHFDLVKVISKRLAAANSLTKLTLSWVIWIGDLDLDELVDNAWTNLINLPVPAAYAW